MSSTGKAVFLSYASQDAEAAQRICDALRAAGVEVWFDQNELVGGDVWDAKIRKQIKDCALFVPIISRNTQVRLEGYFRLEWKLAAQRTHTMAAAKAFLLPVVIDDTREADAHVPEEFTAVQWTRLRLGSGGQPPDDVPRFAERVRRMLDRSDALAGPARLSVPATHGSGLTEVGSQPGPRPRGWRRIIYRVVSLALLTSLATVAFWMFRAARQSDAAIGVAPQSSSPATGTPPVVSDHAATREKSLVVLPLENLSPDPENAFFTDGIHAEIITTLSQIAELKVISRNSALAFKGAALPLAEIARKLGVANVLTGSVRRVGGTVRIQLELRRASDEALLWSLPKADRDLRDVLALQSEIADQVARVLQARQERGSFAGARFLATDPRVYDLYLKAHSHYNANASDPALIAECMAMMAEALRLDPGFMPAARLAGRMATRLFLIADEPADRLHAASEAKKWSEQASRLMPGGAGDGALAFYLNIVEGDAVRALSTAENAIRALPNDVEGYHVAALALRDLGRPAEAAKRWTEAEALDIGGVPSWGNHIVALSRLRRPQECEELIAQYQRVKSGVNIRMANEYAVDEARFALHGTLPASLIEIPSRTERAGWLWRLRRFEALLALCEEQLAAGARGATRFSWLRRKCDALLRLDRGEEARVVAREALALAQTMNAGPKLGQPADNWRLAIALAHLGRAEEALARAQSYVDGVPAVSLGRRWSREIEQARIHVLVGRHATCVELLAKLLRVPSGLTVPMLKVEPDWDALREDAAFKALLADPRNLEPL